MRALLLVLFLPAGARAGAFTPAPGLDFGRTPQALAQDCQKAEEEAGTGLLALARLPPNARTFANTPAALDRILADLNDRVAADAFLKDVSVSSSTRDASHVCVVALAKFGVDVFTREDLYAALKAYAEKNEPLAGEDRRLLDKELLDFKRNGLLLPAEKRAEVKKIKQRIVELEQTFQKNLSAVKDYALMTKPELAGLPDDYVQRLEKIGVQYKVTLDYPDYFPFMENAKDPGARRRLEALFNNRAAKENLPLFKETLALRGQAARLLGYPSHADYVLEDRMAKDAKTVDAFIDRVLKKLRPLGGEELKALLALKKKDEGAGSDGVIHAWDWRYYHNQLKKTRYQVDQEKIKEYFPMDLVTEGLLGVYQELLGVKFRRIPDAAVWHPDVSLHEITDAAGGPALAYFYMDLFPREGKYKHAAAFDLIRGRTLPDGSYRTPVAAMVANFNKPTPGRPSLLKHGANEEVETFFHEFGHIMHQTLTRARYARFSGSNVAQDFVEAPSQMLENWVWKPEVLNRLSGHYADHNRKLPPELLKKMIAAKNADVSLVYLRQLFFGAVDMRYHTEPDIKDTTTVYEELQGKISLIPMSPGTHPEASFGHLMGGYDSGYYGYLWSKVYAQDMFSVFDAAGVLNPAIGRRYRREILEPGRGREESESLRAFLRREPNEDAFLKSLGLSSKRS